MTALRRGGRPRDEGRVLEVEDSTVARAGESATRVALEETLLRKGWRVLWFEDTVGPLEGADRARLLDGVAVRMRPGEDESLEFRLLRVQSGTLEIPEGATDRMERVTGSLDASWLLAAFDGEQMRLIPDPDEERDEPERPPSRGERQPSRGQPPPERGRALQRPPEPVPEAASEEPAGPRGRSRRRGARGARVAAGGASGEARQEPADRRQPASQARQPATHGRQTPRPPQARQRAESPQGSSRPDQPVAKPTNGRRRGRRGGRGRRR